MQDNFIRKTLEYFNWEAVSFDEYTSFLDTMDPYRLMLT